MKRIFLIPTMVFGLFITGCAGGGLKGSTQQGAEVSHADMEGHDLEIHLEDELILDNGKKWTANLETNEGIDQMLAIIKKEESKEPPAYMELKESLDQEFNIILEKCTMTGDSHDQLHHYLIPLKAKFEKLDAGSNKETIEEIKNHLLVYYDYFE